MTINAGDGAAMPQTEEEVEKLLKDRSERIADLEKSIKMKDAEIADRQKELNISGTLSFYCIIYHSFIVEFLSICDLIIFLGSMMADLEKKMEQLTKVSGTTHELSKEATQLKIRVAEMERKLAEKDHDIEISKSTVASLNDEYALG